MKTGYQCQERKKEPIKQVIEFKNTIWALKHLNGSEQNGTWGLSYLYNKFHLITRSSGMIVPKTELLIVGILGRKIALVHKFR